MRRHNPAIRNAGFGNGFLDFTIRRLNKDCISLNIYFTAFNFQNLTENLLSVQKTFRPYWIFDNVVFDHFSKHIGELFPRFDIHLPCFSFPSFPAKAKNHAPSRRTIEYCEISKSWSIDKFIFPPLSQGIKNFYTFRKKMFSTRLMHSYFRTVTSNLCQFIIKMMNLCQFI